MSTFAPHRDTLEAFVDCINGAGDEGVETDALSRLLAVDVVIHGPFGDDPVTGREAVVKTIRSVNGLSSDDTYTEVLSGDTHHAAHFRLQVGDAAVNGIYLRPARRGRQDRRGEHLLPHAAGRRRAAAEHGDCSGLAAVGTTHE